MYRLSLAGVRHHCRTLHRSLQNATVASATKPKVIVVTGPTAVGKSAVGLALAKRLNGEVISADSVQVYRGLDVGSDKVTVEVRQEVPHHLIDIFPPTVDFNAGHFYELGRKAIDDILQRGKVPIVVGGTGFYLRWLVDGRPSTPPSNPELEQQVQERIEIAWAVEEQRRGSTLSKEEQWAVAVQLLVQDGDPEAALRIGAEQFNYYRLRRALQILHLSPGRTLADLEARPSVPLYDFRCFFLNRPRIPLWGRIMGRCEQMVEGGLLEEAVWLEQQMAVEGVTQCQAAKAIGYYQALDFLQKVRAQGEVSDEDVRQLVRDVASGTRELVRKQLHWFRREQGYHWVDIAEGHGAPEAMAALLQHLELPEHIGGGGEERTLTKEEARALKMVQHDVVRFKDPLVTAPVVEWVRRNVLLPQLQQQQQQQQQGGGPGAQDGAA